jgi:putative ABC transport system permease protein
LGFAGTILGLAIGIPMSNLLVGFLGTELIGAELDWQISWLAVGLSVVVGLGGTVLASLPALRRVAHIPVREAMGTPGITGGYGQGAIDRGLRRVGFLPRDWQLGLRGAARRKGRSVATAVQVALAVGTMLAFTSTVITMLWVSEQSRTAEGGDIQVWSTGGGAILGDAAGALLGGIDGVDRVQPIVGADVLAGDTDTFVWGLPDEPVYAYELSEGRWFDGVENEAAARVAVVGPALANLHSLEVGDDVRVETASGVESFLIVGIDTTMVGDGLGLFVPIKTVMEIRGLAEPSQFWLTTTSSDHGSIDRVALELRGELERRGYGFDYQVRYIDIEAERTADRTVVAIILSLGVPVVAIGMIGLVNTMTTSIVERSREIGVLRSVGARARDIRRIFRSEAVALVVLGWLVGTGVGYVLARVILGVINDAFHVDFGLRYPLWPLGAALAVALAVVGLAMVRPLTKASRIPASEALRYE